VYLGAVPIKLDTVLSVSICLTVILFTLVTETDLPDRYLFNLLPVEYYTSRSCIISFILIANLLKV
jgi:hypothetical protein